MNAIASLIEQTTAGIDSPDTVSESNRIKALMVYAETNSPSAAAKASGLSLSYVSRMMEEDGIESFVDRLRKAMRERFAWRYMEGMELAFNALIKNVIEGEERLDRRGNIVTVRPGLKDCATTLGILQDKQAALTSGLEGQTNVSKALSALADALLTELANRGRPPDSPPLPVSSYMG
jgi:molybdenum-dependent DNA-binding transcriptional regulator ModE